MPKRYVEYRDALACDMADIQINDYWTHTPAEGTYGFKAIFFRHGQRKADIDNLLKTVSDAATGIFWADDSQVREQYGLVIYGSTDPRVEIEIYELTGG